MCKVMAIAGIKKTKVASAWKFIKASRQFMTERDNDGTGYAASSPKGLFSERWRYPGQAFKLRHMVPHDQKLVEEYGEIVGHATNRYGSYGDVKNQYNADSIIFHARAATCDKTLQNTHPFIRDNVALIHNGIISNARNLKLLQSTCDSEAILNEYVDKNVTKKLANIQNVADELEGWYACAVLTTLPNGDRVLDIFKDNTTSLVCAFVPMLETVVFCTNIEIIKKTLKCLKWGNITETFTISGPWAMRIDCKTGKLLEKLKFEPNDYYAAGWGGRGYVYDSADDYYKKNKLPIVVGDDKGNYFERHRTNADEVAAASEAIVNDDGPGYDDVVDIVSGRKRGYGDSY